MCPHILIIDFHTCEIPNSTILTLRSSFQYCSSGPQIWDNLLDGIWYFFGFPWCYPFGSLTAAIVWDISNLEWLSKGILELLWNECVSWEIRFFSSFFFLAGCDFVIPDSFLEISWKFTKKWYLTVFCFFQKTCDVRV